MKDYIPQNWAALAVWLANFSFQLQGLALKYNVPESKVTQIGLDNTWVQYWVEARNSAKQQEKQLSDYFTEIVRGDLGAPQPTQPIWELPSNPPPFVSPGINKRIREIAASIKAQKSIYTRADGELLGIVTPEEAGFNEMEFTPEVRLRSLSNYAVEADFRKYGLDALRIEYRHKNGNWQLAAILTSSPGVFNVVPTTFGNAEQIEVRAVFVVKNQIFGNYSPSYTIVIQP